MDIVSSLAYMFNRKVDSSASVSVLSKVTKSSIGPGCIIARGSRVLRSTLGEKCEVGRRVNIKGSTLCGFNGVAPRARLKNVSLGVYSYISKETSLVDISIGKFCSIGKGVKNHLGNHPSRVFVSSHPAFYSPNAPTGSFVKDEYFKEFGKNVSIQNDVWIGSGALLMDGVTVGNGAIVGARSVVTKDVPPYAIVGGIPAKIIRYRFDEEEIDFLEKSQWWDKDLLWIKKHVGDFHDVKNFTKALRNEDATESGSAFE